VALSSDDAVLAAGDASGRILIWRDLLPLVPVEARSGAHAGKQQLETQPPLTTLHWHPSALGCLAFSPDTVYLLSGGQEGVLVMWQLEHSKPTFLPRCASAMRAMCPNLWRRQARGRVGCEQR
jgi:NET1-associated nuclear protein 1 (U3 small nucleolar RNA-associated protein 17)